MLNLVTDHQLSARFTLIRSLGKGGMCEVWLAEDKELGEQVALKILDPKLADSSWLVDLLRNECRNSRRLVHPHIVRCYDFHQAEGLYFISMAYVQGSDIGDLRKAPIKDILRAIVPVTDALAYAHKLGMVHRDIKASNVLLDESGTPYLTDFGIASVLNEADGLVITSGGSPSFMSPQQLADESPAPADDVFSLGVLLYGLITDKMPFGSDPKARSSHAEPIEAREELPDRLKGLVMSMLAQKPQDRPASMEAVKDELTAILWETYSASPDTPAEVEPHRITPVSPALTAMHGDTEFVGESQEPKRFLSGTVITVAFLILFSLLVGVVFYLPDAVKDRPVEVPRQAPAPVVQEREAAPVVPAEREPPAYSEEDKEAAEDALAELIHKQEYLEEKAVEEWAAEEYEQAKQLAGQGDGFFRQKDYRAAAVDYQASIEILNGLAERIEPIVEQALAAGLTALDAGKAAAAKSSFELVLRIEPENPAAIQGLARAQNIEEVFRLIREGREHEEAGELRQARNVFREARDLDPAVAEAHEALSRLAGKIAADSFLEAMSMGLTALDQGQYEAAIQAFNEAKRMRPGSVEAVDGLAQAEEGKRLEIIAGHRQRAESFEPEEKWHEALDEYRAVLRIDSSLAFAQEGEARAAMRAELADRFGTFLGDPERVYSPEVHANVGYLLQQAMAVADKGPVLSGQISKLTRLLQLAQTPIAVSLESDAATDVVIYKVGRLGAFDSRQLELLPGTYTVVGTRSGYRDVRQSFKILPGEPLGPVVVRCEEKI